MVSAKCTFQLSRSSTLASAAAMPPSAITVCALPRSDLQTSPTDTPAADASMAARSPAPPAPITSTSCSWVSYSAMSKDPQVGNDAQRTQADVEVGETHGKQRQPCPFHVAFVEQGADPPQPVTRLEFGGGVRAAEAVHPPPDQVPHRVTAQGKGGQENHVHHHDERAEADAELAAGHEIPAAVGRPPEGDQGVISQQEKEEERDVHRVAVHVLQDHRQVVFAAVPFP